jgi:uncharacterized UBP type Zn finger protein
LLGGAPAEEQPAFERKRQMDTNHETNRRDSYYRALRKLWTGSEQEIPCEHLHDPQPVVPSSLTGCADCLAMGDDWLHLRICLTCGYVGCCDKAKNQHMLKHHQKTGHPLIQSFEPGEDWIWCYVDQALLAPPDGEPLVRRSVP